MPITQTQGREQARKHPKTSTFHRSRSKQLARYCHRVQSPSMKKIHSLALIIVALLTLSVGCDRTLTSSKLTTKNYDQITDGMTKAQVERIMGPPTSTETKDMIIFKRTTYRYEDGAKFALFTFKNDELETKEGNLAAQR